MNAAGPLSDRLALTRLGAPEAAEGGFFQEPETYATVWAEVAPATAAWVERVIGRQVQAPMLHIARIYYRSDVHVDDEGVWTDRRGGTHPVTVRGLRTDPAGTWLWLALEERLPTSTSVA